MTARPDPPESGRRGLIWLITAMAVLLVVGVLIDQVASGFRTARKLATPVDPTAVVTGAGVAFRCRDTGNCWWVQAVPAFHTWNIIRIVDGNASLMGNLGPVSVESGTTIEVETGGDRIEVSVDGVRRRTIISASLRDNPGAGLMIAGGERTGQAHWDDFSGTSAATPVEDTFDRPDADRLRPNWRPEAGVWGIRDEQASVVRSAPAGLNLALVDVGVNARISATLTTGTPPSRVTDDFSRPDVGSLGVATTGQPWRARRGVWGIQDGQAFVSRSVPRGLNLAVVQGGASDGTVEVAVTRMARGAGLAFRCRGPGNCWRVEAVPRFGTWNVLKVVRNTEQVVANLGPVPVEPGTVVKVEMEGPRLRFFVNGVARRTVRDLSLRNATGVGLVIPAGSQADVARWDSFSSTPDGTASRAAGSSSNGGGE